MGEFAVGDRVLIDEAGEDVPAVVERIASNGDLWCKADNGTTYRVPTSMVRPAL